PDAARAWVFVARSRTVNVPAALNVAETGEPVAGWAPPSKFHTSVSPEPLPEKLPSAPAVRVAGGLLIVAFGNPTVTATACHVLRPPLHAEKGRNRAAGMLLPFRLTASVPSSKVHGASRRTFTGLVVSTAPSGGVGATKVSGLGLGSGDAGGARPSTMASTDP